MNQRRCKMNGGKVFTILWTIGSLSGLVPSIAVAQIVDVERLERSIATVVVVDGTIRDSTQPIDRAVESIVNPNADILPGRVGLGVVLGIQNRQVDLLTPAHLVEAVAYGAGELPPLIVVIPVNSTAAEATVVAADPRSGLAVIRFSLSENSDGWLLPVPVEFDAQAAATRLQRCIAFGNPHAMVRGQSLSAGSVTITRTRVRQQSSAESRLIDLPLAELGGLLELDAASQFADSGAPLFHEQGQLSGMILPLLTSAKRQTDILHAIPMQTGYLRIVRELRAGFEVEYGFLGVHVQPALPEELRQLPDGQRPVRAVVVSRVIAASPAEDAGLQPGDLLLSVAGQVIEDEFDFVREVAFAQPGEMLQLTRFRPGIGVEAVSAIPGKSPVYDDSKIVSTGMRYPVWRGLSVDYSTARRRYLTETVLTQFPSGVVVVTVSPGSVASQLNLQVGQRITHVNERPIRDPQSFYKAVDSMTGEVKLQLASGMTLTLPEAN